MLVLGGVGVANAHANLVHSEPAAGAVLTSAPSEVVLEFSEDLDPDYTRVQLFNSANQLVSPGPGAIDPAYPRVLQLPLNDLPQDSYAAVWRARSAVDGHITNGSVPFGIGVPVSGMALIPPRGAPEPATAPPPTFESLVRWLNLLAVIVALGGLPFGLFVWRPAVIFSRRNNVDVRAADQFTTHAIRRLIILGGGLSLFANLLFLMVQAANAADLSLIQALGVPMFHLLGGYSGQIWLARVLLIGTVGLIGWRLPLAGTGPTRLWWTALALSSGIALTFSLTAHAAATKEGVITAVAMDWLHIVAAISWLGGLIPLAIALQAGRQSPKNALPLSILIPRFSRLALGCVAAVALSGLYGYFLHVNRLDLLAATTYGRALLAKSAVFTGLFALGAVNLLLLSPRLPASGNSLARAFSRTVRTELLLGGLLLTMVGIMTSVAPSQTAWEAQEKLGVKKEAELNDVHIVFRAAPAHSGDNEFAVDVTDRRPGTDSVPAEVLLRFTMLSMDMGTLQIATRTVDGLRYTAHGSFLSMAGNWQVEVIIRRSGFNDVVSLFPVVVRP
jgi:copper transport protein